MMDWACNSYRQLHLLLPPGTITDSMVDISDPGVVVEILSNFLDFLLISIRKCYTKTNAVTL